MCCHPSSVTRHLRFPLTSRTSAFAFRNQDGASVRCIPEKGIVVFFIYTTAGEQEGRALLEQLHAVYRAPQAPSGGGKF